MIGALWTGISGLASQQKALDNESNNIANVNTIGYKASRISFADQMYQDRIGKGSTVLDAEKLYTQGGSKLTGVNYDMALYGDGFFSVVNKNTLGTAETFYTRAGNFRMGDNGTLQDSAGNEVQGWMMTAIDSQNDVTSTNPNVSVFNNDYTKLLGSKIIRHGTYVETVTAKATDYNLTAKSDSTTAFSGDGAKTKSAKISDIEEAIKDYTSWLQKLKDEPDALSSTSITQTSQVNFKSGTDSIIGADGHQIYIYINGEKKSQEFIVSTASQALKVDLYNSLSPAEITAYGLVNPGTIAAPNTLTDTQNAAYDKLAGKIATYKAMADKISNMPGLVATMAIDSGSADVFNITETYTKSTKNSDMLKGIIQIKSLIPGQEFRISEIGEEANKTILQGNFQTQTAAAKGSGIAGLETSKEALSKLITGKQQDVYTTGNLQIDGTAKNYTYAISIYDKEIGQNISVPSSGVINIAGATSLDDIINGLNADPSLSKYVTARNVNGNLVLETLDSNYDVEFTGSMKLAGTPIDVNANYSGRKGAGAEFIEIINKVDQTASKGSLQLRLDTLGISDSAFGEFSVDSTGLITMKQDGADFAIGQVAIAVFNNNRGLNPVGNNLLAKTNESGEPVYNLNNNKTAEIKSKTLELSTADLSESLVNLMVFQRAFEANAKSITTSDELLNTLINLKR
ncbi:flagellar biosynthesis protein FlgE [Arcobacter suis]|uniref:Flagellar hook protein, epsilonproteobacterial variant n=1 Tax=Arcobacter suis CECT 7833 TaxID=663365 RepID=A0AAD0STJ6_9BACT|nr:flagellar hook-basal body complex protein [Arcobacter suis]AXX90603.1 flagellar hook protein, epsilonproteobacterial variant [Arcobacter suis CECT 7833]RWS46282.1 flagellar biosynthesis protein FlgE [Arcobacter suis]